MEVKDLKVLQHIHTLKILLGREEHLTEKFSNQILWSSFALSVTNLL